MPRMLAAVLKEYGADPVVEPFEDPEAGSGQLALDVLAAGLNPIDLRIASGVLADRRPPLPSVAGTEGIGRDADGRRVYFNGCAAPFGSLAERTLVAADSVVPVPDGVEDAHAVCYGVAGIAAWGALVRRAPVQAGETVLILGATGVVGMIAVQVARLRGAGTVVAAGRSADGLRRARELGADATVDLGAEDLKAAYLDAAGGPLDLVFDPLWGDPAAAALGALKPGGRLVQLGQSAGAQATLASADVRFKQLTIMGYTNFALTAQEQAEGLQALWGHAAAGEMVAEFETVPLADAVGAWQRTAGSPGRKLVVTP